MAPPVAGYVRWWDASITSSITQSGGFVSQWNDQSTTADHVTQIVAGNQPVTNLDTINGLNVIKFDGADDVLNGGNHAVAQPATMFAVVASTDISLTRYAVDSAAADQLLGGSTAGWLMYAGTQIQGGTFATGTHILSAVFNGASSQLWVDGTSVASGNAGAQALNNFAPGGSLGAWQGDIAEIIVYPSGLNTTDRQSVEAYLTAKWVPAPVVPPDAGPLQIAPPPGFLSPVATLRFPLPRGEDEIHTGITVTVDGHGDIASTGTAELLLTADLSGHGDAAATGTADLLLLADLQSHGDAASAGRAEPLLLADLQGHGDAASAGRADLLLLADLSGDGEIANTGIAELLLLADLSGHGDAATTGAADITVTPQGGSAVSLDGHGDIASAGQAELLLAADFQGDGEAANTGRAELLVLLDLAGDGEVACAGTASLTVTLDLSGHGDVATAGAAAITAALDLAGHGDASTTGQLLTDVIAAVVATDSYTTGARRSRILTITVIFRYPKRLHQTCEITARSRHYCPRGTHTRIRTEMLQQERFTPRSAYRVRIMTEADRLRDDLEAITTLFRAR